MLNFEAILPNLGEALFVVVDPGKRLFWLHLLSAAALAFLYFRFSSTQLSYREMLSKLLNPRYWWNRSTQLDYALFVLNSFLKVVLFAPVLGGQVVLSLTVTRFLHFNVAESHIYIWPPLAISIVFTLVAFVFDDFTRFLVHALMHKIPLLWRVHKVHHSATTLTPFTVHRTHPVESLINATRAVISLGLVSGVFVWFFGHGLQVWDILGVNALGFAMTLLGSNLRHSHVPMHFGLAESLLISPAQHQLHHSRDHMHPNLGSFLSCWDRLCGTWASGRQANELHFGLPATNHEPRVSTHHPMPWSCPTDSVV